MDLEELYQQVILDHSKRPRNFGELPGATASAHGDNPSCGDEITLQIKIGEGDVIEEIKFTGQGCAISQSSASMMTLKVKKKTRAEAMQMQSQFHDMLVCPDCPPLPASVFGDLKLLEGVKKFPQRVKCATLAWQALKQVLTDPASETTTEDDSL